MSALDFKLEDETSYVREAVPRILPILVAHAQNSRILTYKDLALQIDEVRRLRHLDKPLDAIGRLVRTRSVAGHGAPPLETIVVKSGPKKLPGKGANYLLEGYLKKTGVIRSSAQFMRNRQRYVELVRRDIFSFPWQRVFGASELNVARRTRRAKKVRGSSMDPGASGIHFRSSGSVEGRQNPIVLALESNLPIGWHRARSAKSRCDLAARGPKGTKIFEVKCSVGTQDMCTALGELLFHVETNRPAQGVLVVPGNQSLQKEWIRLFRKHHFPIVAYLSKEGGFEFQNLASALAA